jgi:hypothetical protein
VGTIKEARMEGVEHNKGERTKSGRGRKRTGNERFITDSEGTGNI